MTARPFFCAAGSRNPLLTTGGAAARIAPGCSQGKDVMALVRTLVTIFVLVILFAVAALFTNGWDYFIGGLIGAISGPIAYYFCKRRYGGLATLGESEEDIHA